MFGLFLGIILENWTELLEQAGMDQRELAIALDSSPSVISALVNNVTGKSAAGKKLKRKALDYLLARIGGSDSVVGGRSESEASGVAAHEDSVEYRSENEWKQEALQLREEVKRMRNALHELTAPLVPEARPPSKVSYARGLTEAQAIAKRAGEQHDAHPRK